MNAEELLAELRVDFPEGHTSGAFMAAHVADGAYTPLLSGIGVAASVALESDDGWTRDGDVVTLTATATDGLLNVARASVLIRFTPDDAGFTLLIDVALPASWTFGTSFRMLASDVFDALRLVDPATDPARSSSLVVASAPVADPRHHVDGGDVIVPAGLSFYGFIAPNSSVLTQMAWILGDHTPGTVEGPIAYDAASGSVTMNLPLVEASVTGLFGPTGPQLDLELSLYCAFSEVSNRYIPGVRFSASLPFGAPGNQTRTIELSAVWETTAQGMLDLALAGSALEFPTPSALAEYFGAGNDIASSLPAQFNGGALVAVDAITIGLGVGRRTIEYAALSVSVLPGQDWPIFDPLVLRDTKFLFVVSSPFASPSYAFSFSATLDLAGVAMTIRAGLGRTTSGTGTGTTTFVLNGFLEDHRPAPLRPLLLRMFGRDFGMPADLAITALDFFADTGQSIYGADLEIEGEWPVQFGEENTVVFRDLRLAFSWSATDGAQGELRAVFDVGEQEFTVTLDLAANAIVFRGEWETLGDPITFQDIAIALGMYGLANPPEGVDIALTSAAFEIDTSGPTFTATLDTASHGGAAMVAGKNEQGTAWGFIYGMVIGLDIEVDLTKIDVVGDLVPSGVDVLALKNLRIVAATTTLPTYTDNEVLRERFGPVVSSGVAMSIELLVGDSIQETFTVRFGGADDGSRSDRPPSAAGVLAPLVPAAVAVPPMADETKPAPQATWVNVQRAFGPVQIDRVGASMRDDGKIALLLDAAVSTAGLRIGLTGLEAAVPLEAPFTPSFDLAGLAVAFTGGGAKIAGSLVKSTGPPVGYGGSLTVVIGTFGMTALGAYSTVGGQPSLFAFLFVDVPIGGPPFFFITGLAGGFGYNRSLQLPAIGDVAQFPLVKGAMGTLDAGNTRAQLEQRISPAVNQHWLAAGVRFTSFEMLKSFALVTVAFGADFEIALLGQSTLSVPPSRTPGSTPVAQAEMVLLVSFAPSAGVLAVDARLTPASYVLRRDAQLTGGFAFYSWFQPSDFAGDFVVTLGGYNPYFPKPKHYPAVPRLGLNWQIDSHLVIKGGLYFAITPSVLMAGGFLQATWTSGSIKAWFDAQADFLIRFKPFRYEISVRVSIGASFTVDLWFTKKTVTIHVGVDLHLWGPPFGGTARVDLSIISFTIAFGAPKPPPVFGIGWAEFRDSFLPPVDGNLRSDPSRMLATGTTIATDSLLTIGVASGLAGTIDVDGVDVRVIDPGGAQLAIRTQVPSTNASVTAQAAFQPSGTWNRVFGVGPMNAPPGTPVVDVRIRISRPDGTSDTWSASASTGNVPKGLWYSATSRMEPDGLVRDVLLGVDLVPVAPTPETVVAVPISRLSAPVPHVVTVAWSTTPVPTHDPFDGQQAMAVLQATLADAAVSARRATVLGALRAEGLTTAPTTHVDAFARAAPDLLFSPPRLRYLGEQPLPQEAGR